jgi:hypothetical protein
MPLDPQVSEFLDDLHARDLPGISALDIDELGAMGVVFDEGGSALGYMAGSLGTSV